MGTGQIYLTDSYEEVTMDFVKDHKELYKTNEHFKDKARKECLWEMFTNSHNLSVKVSKVKPKGLAMPNSDRPSLVCLQKK